MDWGADHEDLLVFLRIEILPLANASQRSYSHQQAPRGT